MHTYMELVEIDFEIIIYTHMASAIREAANIAVGNSNP